MDNSENTLLQEFQKQKVSQESETLQTAQRFINQFRSLRFFSESFADEYNRQLLACSQDVRRFFPSLMGGNEVRSYLEFLERKMHQNQPESQGTDQPDISVGSYLPTPDLDRNQSSEENISVPKSQWQEIQAQQKTLMEQTQQLLRQLNSQKNVASGSSVMGHYAEIIDEENSNS